MLCIVCGKITDSTDICEHCKAPLPSRTAMPPYQNGPMLEVAELIADWEDGKMNFDELEKRIKERTDFYNSRLSEVLSMDVPEDVRAEISEELSIGRMGLESLLRAFDLVKQYAQNDDISVRSLAIQAAESGTKMLNKAMRLNWKSYAMLQASTEEMLALAQKSV